MIYNDGLRTGRIICTPETDEERDLLQHVCLGSSRSSKKVNVWSVADSIVNRRVLSIPYRIKPPISTQSVPKVVESPYPLKDYQLADVQHMLTLRSVLNANPMGYGKTVEALVYLRNIRATRILILCPKSVKTQWAQECSKWIDYLKVEVDPKVVRAKFANIVITNYEQLRNNVRYDMYQSVYWDCVVVDEAHRLKNSGTATTKLVKGLNSYNRVALTGTPIMRHPDDLHSIFDFLDSEYFGWSYWNFVTRFCDLSSDYGELVPQGLTRDTRMQDVLSDTLKLFTIRNPPGAVGVGLHEYSVTLGMYPKQAKLYSQVKTLAIDTLEEQGISITNGFTQLVKLQQITSNPGMFNIANNIKFEWILDLLTGNLVSKLLVFSKHRTTIQALEVYLTKHKIQHSAIHGDISSKARNKAKRDFIDDPQVSVMLGTIGALGESVDGLQQVCSTVVFLDKDWSPSSNNQAVGRVLRYGQQLPVQVYTLICSGTIDEHVGRVNLFKVKNIQKVLRDKVDEIEEVDE